MKKLLISSVFSLALVCGALDLAVKPLRTNGLKSVSIKDSTVRGIGVPGGSIDFPLPAKEVDMSKFNRAVLTIAPAEGGETPVAEDLRLNLRSAKDKNKQLESVGVAGEKPGEVVFRLIDAPADTYLVRLYVDEMRRFNGQTIALTAVSFTFDDGAADVGVPLGYARLNNCDKVTRAVRTFGGIPKNTGAAVILTLPTYFKSEAFQKVEVKLTVIEGTLAPEALELNPRNKSVSKSGYCKEEKDGKYVFTFKEPFTDPTSLFFYFNRKAALTGKPVKFRIDAIRLMK